MCFPGPGHPPGVLVSHDHWRAAPQSHRHSKSCFCFCILMTFYVSPRLNSKSCLQPASLRSPLMFSLVNYTSAFSEFKVLPSARHPGYLLMFFRVASRHPGWVIVAWGSCWRSPKWNIMQLSNAQSHWVKGLLADVSQPREKVAFVGESPELMTHRRSPQRAPPPLVLNVCGPHSGLMYLVITVHYHCGRASHSALCTVDPVTQRRSLQAVKRSRRWGLVGKKKRGGRFGRAVI